MPPSTYGTLPYVDGDSTISAQRLHAGRLRSACLAVAVMAAFFVLAIAGYHSRPRESTHNRGAVVLLQDVAQAVSRGPSRLAPSEGGAEQIDPKNHLRPLRTTTDCGDINEASSRVWCEAMMLPPEGGRARREMVESMLRTCEWHRGARVTNSRSLSKAHSKAAA